MRKHLSLILALGLLSLQAQEVLKPNQLDKLKQTRQKEQLEADLTKDSWINPLSIEADINKSKNIDKSTNKSKKVFLNFEQDIFRSGGIYYTILKGKEEKKLSQINYQSNFSTNANEVFLLVLNLQKIDLQLQKQAYLIHNKTLEIEKKESQYLNGTIDIEALDEAIIEKNDLLNAKEDLNISKEEYISQLKNLSQHPYTSIQPEVLSVLTLESFLAQNHLLIKSRLDTKIKKLDRKITLTNYLPKISLYSQVGYEDNESSSLNDDYYNYGIKLSIPINYNMNKNNEVAQLNYKLSQINTSLEEQNEKQEHKKTLQLLSHMDKKIQNSKLSIKKYQSIYNLTKELYEGLLKTKEDLKTIENRLQSSKLDIKILELDKQIEMYNLAKRVI